MKTIDQICEALELIMKVPRSDNYVQEFEHALSESIDFSNPEIIGVLINFLDDAEDYPELMYSIIHSVEVFEDKVYIGELLKTAAKLCTRSPKWASIVFMRVLNSDSCKRELIRQVRLCDADTKSAIKRLMEDINQVDTSFLEKTVPVLASVS